MKAGALVASAAVLLATTVARAQSAPYDTPLPGSSAPPAPPPTVGPTYAPEPLEGVGVLPGSTPAPPTAPGPRVAYFTAEGGASYAVLDGFWVWSGGGRIGADFELGGCAIGLGVEGHSGTLRALLGIERFTVWLSLMARAGLFRIGAGIGVGDLWDSTSTVNSGDGGFLLEAWLATSIDLVTWGPEKQSAMLLAGRFQGGLVGGGQIGFWGPELSLGFRL